jgi:hypothetical protein
MVKVEFVPCLLLNSNNAWKILYIYLSLCISMVFRNQILSYNFDILIQGPGKLIADHCYWRTACIHLVQLFRLCIHSMAIRAVSFSFLFFYKNQFFLKYAVVYFKLEKIQKKKKRHTLTFAALSPAGLRSAARFDIVAGNFS